ncbi:MAG: hypothetical protein OER88_04800, partial [Planctomycetota bacterium]|nr:hypothetical protein [Planctomycetota bacterium]
MIDALREAEAARDADRDADAARDRAEQARTRLLAVLKRYPALSLDLVAEMDRLNEPRVVRQLGQTLRFVRSDALVAELRRRVSDGHRAADRQAALLALEARPWASWNDVAAAAYRGDD